MQKDDNIGMAQNNYCFVKSAELFYCIECEPALYAFVYRFYVCVDYFSRPNGFITYLQ